MFEALSSAPLGIGPTIWSLAVLFAMEILVAPVVLAIVLGCLVGLARLAEVLIGVLRTQISHVTHRAATR